MIERQDNYEMTRVLNLPDIKCKYRSYAICCSLLVGGRGARASPPEARMLEYSNWLDIRAIPHLTQVLNEPSKWLGQGRRYGHHHSNLFLKVGSEMDVILNTSLPTSKMLREYC